MTAIVYDIMIQAHENEKEFKWIRVSVNALISHSPFISRAWSRRRPPTLEFRFVLYDIGRTKGDFQTIKQIVNFFHWLFSLNYIFRALSLNFENNFPKETLF